ncbi:MAG: Co2+/Mg2+ efflux protein ApaG [Bacteriovoracaceae bacterium]
MIQEKAIYSDIDKNVKICVTPYFVNEKSKPDQNFYLYKYRIIISNEGSKTIQLLARCWKIRDGKQKEEVIRGPGVIGKTPILGPQESFSYESFCPLSTPTGNMRGYFEFIELEEQNKFKVKVPLFFFRLDH